MRSAAAALVAALFLTACATPPPPAGDSRAYADYLIGRLANSRDDYEAAAQRYFAALERAPHDETLLNGAVVSSLASGDAAGARRAAALAPRRGAPAYAHLVRASDALVARRWRNAGGELSAVEGAAAEELLGRIVLVWVRAAEGRLDEATADLAPLSGIRPYGGLFAYQQAMALDLAGRQEEALTAYARAEEGGLWLPPAIERRADLLARMGRREEAERLLDTETNRANPALAASLQRVRAGGAVSSEPLTPARGAAVGLYGLSAIYLQEGGTTDGLAALQLALMLDPHYDGARIAFAQQQSQLGRYDIARRTLADVASDSPYASAARVMDAAVLLDSDEPDQALALARVNAEGGDARARRALADMYRSLDRHGEAEPIYTELLQATPNDWRLYFARGAARERLGRYAEAEADLQHALELRPDQPDVLNYLGYLWVDRGEHLQEGMDLISRAAELRPSSGAIIDSLGWAYYRMGDYGAALDHLERAVELEPADPTLNDHLGDVYWRLNRRIEARFQWQRALTLEADDAAAIQAKLDHGLPPAPLSRSANR